MRDRIKLARWVPIFVVLLCLLLPLGCVRLRSTPEPDVTPTITATAPRPAASATPPPPAITPVPDSPATLRIGWLEAPQSLWPFAEGPTGMDVVFSLVYDRLIHRAPDGTYRPALARDWSSADGGTTWTLDLEPNVVTHDGHPFTAEDVAFSLQRYEGNPRFGYYSGRTPTMETIKVAGPTRLIIGLNQPSNSIEAVLHWIPMLPRHVWENTVISRPEEVDETTLVGTGPFVLREFVPGRRITLGAHKGYWAQPASVDAVVFTTYAEAEALADALQSGSVDLITEVSLDRINELRNDRTIQVVSGLQTALCQLICNVSGEPHSTGHPALLDPQVRLAIAHAVDRQQLVDLALAGQALPGLGLIPPGLHRWFHADLEDVTFDLGEANRILDEAGYADSDGDGVREMPDGGRSLSLRLYVSADSATGDRELDLVSNWLRQIGVQTAPETLLPGLLESTCCPAADYDLILAREEGGPDPGFYLSTLTSAQVATGLNASGYRNPAYDALYEQQAEESDQEQRRQTILQMQEISVNDHPTVVLYYPLAVQAFRRDRFQNWLFVPRGLLALTDPQSLLQVIPVQ